MIILPGMAGLETVSQIRNICKYLDYNMANGIYNIENI